MLKLYAEKLLHHERESFYTNREEFSTKVLPDRTGQSRRPWGQYYKSFMLHHSHPGKLSWSVCFCETF